MWDYNRSSNICVIQVPKEKKVRLKKIFKEIMAKKLPNLTNNNNKNRTKQKHILTDSRIGRNPKEHKSPQIHTKAHHRQISVKTKDKEKKFESGQREMMH